MSWLCARNAACVVSVVDQLAPSRIAPYSPTNVLPVFGCTELFTGCTPARRQNVVAPGLRLTKLWMVWPGRMSTEPAGQVIEDCGPTADEEGGGGGGGGGGVDDAPVAHCFTTPGAGSPKTLLVHGVPPVTV